MVGMQIADVRDDIDHELVSTTQIHDKIAAVAARVSKDYRDHNILLVAVLKGAINTMAAFSQALSIPAQMDFMSISSYGSGTVSSGSITIRQDLSTDVKGRHVLIVEDIVDSGLTLAYLRRNLAARGPASLEVCTLLLKEGLQRDDPDLRYVGFRIPPAFVVGYGLDVVERYRNLPYVAEYTGHLPE